MPYKWCCSNEFVVTVAVAVAVADAAATNIAPCRGVDLIIHFDQLLYGNPVAVK